MAQTENERLKGRNGEIWQGYLAGRTQESLAAEHGITQQVVSAIIKKVRESIPAADREELRRVDLERLDGILPASYALARAGDKDGVKNVLAIMERRSKLLGLDAATKVEASVQRVQLDADVEALLAAHEATRSTESDEQGGA